VSLPQLRWSRVRDAFWGLPALGLTLGVVLGILLPVLESTLGGTSGVLAFGGEPGAARGILSSIAALTVSIIGLSFSVTLVALTLASQQLSPRVLRTFRADRLNQATLAVFLGLAVYALLVLRTVRAGRDPFVPGAGITLAVAATVAALGLFVAFVNNIVISLQPATVVRRITKDGADALGRPRPGEPLASEAFTTLYVLESTRPGYVQEVDAAAACAALADAGRRAKLAPAVGDFLATGDPLLTLDGRDPPGEDLERALRSAVALGQERALGQDVSFPVRQLADIAVKALSPGINDPTTASNALDGISELLVTAVRTELGPSAVRDRSGQLRLALPGPTRADLVQLGVEQVRSALGPDPVPALALLQTLGRVRRAAPAEREAARQAALVVEQFDATGALAADREQVRARHGELFPS
jgi:uncharacterized membrane protein